MDPVPCQVLAIGENNLKAIWMCYHLGRWSGEVFARRTEAVEKHVFQCILPTCLYANKNLEITFSVGTIEKMFLQRVSCISFMNQSFSQFHTNMRPELQCCRPTSQTSGGRSHVQWCSPQDLDNQLCKPWGNAHRVLICFNLIEPIQPTEITRKRCTPGRKHKKHKHPQSEANEGMN